jgi:hypothetical protein
MRLGRCPVCHAHLHLDALVQDEAGRELLGLLATLPADLGRALVGYLTLFRPGKSDLSNDRALRLAREVMALDTDAGRLTAGLHETVDSIRAKGEVRRMTNHNYLKRVLEGMPASAGVSALPAVAVPSPAVARGGSATLDAVQRLQAMKLAARGGDHG